jgi:hypothetical protein
MSTQPIRVPKPVHAEVQTASRLLGTPASELMRAAWEAYRESPEFRETFATAQKAFAASDLSALSEHLAERQSDRVARRAARTRGLRGETNHS